MRFTEIYEHMPSIVIKLVHSEKKARKALRLLGMNDELIPDSDAATFFKSGDRKFVVLISEDSLHHDAAEDIGLLAHEATHIAQGYFLALGEECPSDEFEAYTVGAVTQELYNQHFKWKKKRLADS